LGDINQSPGGTSGKLSVQMLKGTWQAVLRVVTHRLYQNPPE